MPNDSPEKVVGTPIPGEEDLDTSLSPESSAAEERKVAREAVKEKATKLGWKPRTEFSGNPEDFVSAKEFVARQSLFEKIDSLKTVIFQTKKQHEQQLAEIKKYVGQLSETEYKRALTSLQAARRSAISDADAETAELIDEKIDKLQEERAAAKLDATKPEAPTSGEEHPVFKSWAKDNKWYSEDQDMHDDADAIGQAYIRRNPEVAKSNPEKVLEHVTTKIKKMYSDKFSDSTPKKTGQKVEAGNLTNKSDEVPTMGAEKLELSWKDLSADQRKIGDSIVKSGVLDDSAKKNKLSPRDQYLFDMQARLQRSAS